MRAFIWLLRLTALALFALMIFPAGFNTFFGHGDVVDRTDMYLYFVGLMVSAYCVRTAWSDEPTRWRLAGSFVVVVGMLTLLFATGFLSVLDT